jgi:hypothetical protein
MFAFMRVTITGRPQVLRHGLRARVQAVAVVPAPLDHHHVSVTLRPVGLLGPVRLMISK